MTEKAIGLLKRQQEKVPARSAPWMVAEQLMDLCRREPESAAILAADLENKGMGIEDAEKNIRAFADQHKTGNFACVTPIEAENILREFYGLPKPGELKEEAPQQGVTLKFSDFFGKG